MAGPDVFHFYDPATVTTAFGQVDALHPTGHQGVDFAEPEGTPIPPLFDGKVIDKGFDSALGNYVVVQSNNGQVAATYGHLESTPLNIGDTVKFNSGTIGLVGSTGYSTGPHLHLQLIQGSEPIDPMTIIRPLRDVMQAGLLGGKNIAESVIDSVGGVLGSGKDAITKPIDAAASAANATKDAALGAASLFKWLLAAKHWWAIGFIVGGVWLIYLGAVVYMSATETGRQVIATSAKAAAATAA